MSRRTFYAGVVLAGAATLLTGCGATSVGTGAVGTGSGSNTSTQSPSAELASAVSALGTASTLTTSVKLGLTASQVSALAARRGHPLTAGQATAIAGAQVTVSESAPSGKTLAQGAAGSAQALTVTDNGTTYLSVRVVGNVVYLQADVADLLTALGKTQQLAELQAVSAMLPGFVQAFVAGKWISVSQGTVKQLFPLLGVTYPSTPSASPPTPLIKALHRVLARETTVTRTSSGNTDELTVSANARRLAVGLVRRLKRLTPGGGLLLARLHPRRVPSRKLVVTADVTDGALAEVDVNLGQIARKRAIRIPLDVTITRGGTPVTAPTGAVAVKLPALDSLLSGLGGLGGLGSLLGGAGGLGGLGLNS